MKIALVQPQIRNDYEWTVEGLGKFLARIQEPVDLAVFPESLPFWKEKTKAPTVNEAKEQLKELSAPVPFLAGGYVRDNESLANMTFHVQGGQIQGSYRKRRPWDDEQGRKNGRYRIEPGKDDAVFNVGKHKVYPLICNDVGDLTITPDIVRFLYKALERKKREGGGPLPVVVQAYGGELQTDEWKVPLQRWADAMESPVVVCHAAGWIEIDGEWWGGGGSGLFLPGRPWACRQFEDPSIIIVDVEAGDVLSEMRL